MTWRGPSDGTTPPGPRARPRRRGRAVRIHTSPPASDGPTCAVLASARADSASHAAVATTRMPSPPERTKTAAGSLPAASRALPRFRSPAGRASPPRRPAAGRSHRRPRQAADRYSPVARTAPGRSGHRPRLLEFGRGAERLEHSGGIAQQARGRRAGAGLGNQAREGETAEGGLIALAQQVEHARALREIVVGVVRPVVPEVDLGSTAEVVAPRAGGQTRVEAGSDPAEAPLGLVQPIVGKQRLDGEQIGLDGVGGRHAGAGRDVGGDAARRRRGGRA